MRPPLVLAYHGLGSYTRTLDPHNLMVDPGRFRTQIRTLRRRGYRFVRLSELAGQLDAGPLPDRTCALTFDDGTLDNLEVVAPLLAEFDIPATFFVCPGLLGEAHFSFPAAAGVRLMRADELTRLASSPLTEIGSHTSTHADLSLASEEDAYREMVDSRQALQELLQLPVDSFAYPKCGDPLYRPAAARRAGYSVGGHVCGARRMEPVRVGQGVR